MEANRTDKAQNPEKADLIKKILDSGNNPLIFKVKENLANEQALKLVCRKAWAVIAKSWTSYRKDRFSLRRYEIVIMLILPIERERKSNLGTLARRTVVEVVR